MEKLSYAVLALGDKHYEHFCKFGHDLDAKLAALGANRLANRMDCDVDVGEPIARWKDESLSQLNEDSLFQARSESVPPGRPVVVAEPAMKPEGTRPVASFTRESPLLASLVDKRSLTQAASTKSTLHLAFSMEGTGLTYEAGDACGVIPSNDPTLVAEIPLRRRAARLRRRARTS
jgi:sulfite reductase (NADPH) flavoprotein alpha-component